jgi:thiamine-phosphate pyrophosphorylase
MRFDRKDLLLYLVTDRTWLGEDTLAGQVETAVKAGVTLVQLREKELPLEEFLAQAEAVKAVTDRYGIPFLINDNVEVMRKVDADGIHVGQSDMAAFAVREEIGPDRILGVSVETVEQALLAEDAGADYLGVGAVFPTSTKTDADSVSYEELKAICEAVKIPVVAIGGITADNLMELQGSGVAGIAVISAILAKKDISAATKELLLATERMVSP